MKQLLTQIICLWSFTLFAQYTAIPDANFENALSAYDDISNDGQIPTANINTVTFLSIPNQNISDLTGIEGFIALTELQCYQNQLTSLDISTNTALTVLNCSFNQLTALDLSSNTALIDLGCYFNQLATLDLSTNTSLSLLQCNNNQISTLNTATNTALTYLTCSVNQISTLDLSSNTALISLACPFNQLTSLDLSNNASLIELFCFNNQLSDLDVKNGTNTNITQNAFDASNNPDLTCINVDNQNYATSNWTHIDTQTSFNTNCANPVTYVPDSNFETYLETHDATGNVVALGNPDSMGNGIANDHYVTTSQINTVTYLNVDDLNITDLTGIEAFTALETLYCRSNQLTSIELSHNLSLKILDISNNQISSLNVTMLNALENLNVSGNIFSNIDISQNLGLFAFDCRFNQLTHIDVSQHALLQILRCANNQLEVLNVKNGNNTNFTVYYAFLANNNPNLTCIEVDDPAWSTANWTYIDTQSSFNVNCHYGDTYVPDSNFESYLETHDATGNVIALGNPDSMGNGIANDNYIITTHIDTVTHLNINNLSIVDLTGIEDFTALQFLNCYSNSITNINLSNNTALIGIICQGNQITDLDLSQNILLESLDCRSNQISSLDLSFNISLNSLNCMTNILTNINVKNGNNTNMPNYNFVTTNNPNLACIEVDDASWSTTNWTNIDVTSTFVNNQTECDALLSIDDELLQNISIYPNPTKNHVTISSHRVANFKIFTMNGQLVKKGKLSQGENKISISHLNQGLYFIKIADNTVRKLIIQ